MKERGKGAQENAWPVGQGTPAHTSARFDSRQHTPLRHLDRLEASMPQLQELKDRLCWVADLGPAGPLPLIYERCGPQKTMNAMNATSRVL